jgi:hypothetical protein
MAAKLKKARVLRTVSIQGITYEPDQVIELDADVAKSYEEQGALDGNADAVKYCTDELKAEFIKHEAVSIVTDAPPSEELPADVPPADEPPAE